MIREALNTMKFVLKNAEELIAAGFLIITTALVVLNIICRYFFNMGMVWSEEVAFKQFSRVG